MFSQASRNDLWIYTKVLSDLRHCSHLPIHLDNHFIVDFCPRFVLTNINALLPKQLNYGCFATFVLISELMAKLSRLISGNYFLLFLWAKGS